MYRNSFGAKLEFGVELPITWIRNDFACEIRPSNIICDNT